MIQAYDIESLDAQLVEDWYESSWREIVSSALMFDPLPGCPG